MVKRQRCPFGQLGRIFLELTREAFGDSKRESLIPHSWNQTISLPITYPSLLLTSQIAFTIWDVQGSGKPVPVGGTTMEMFTSKRSVYPLSIASFHAEAGSAP